MERTTVPDQYKSLVEAARKARLNAYAPNSGYRVGAAVLTSDDQIFTGANIEPRTQSLASCAERTALFCAVAQGNLSFKALAIVSDDASFPCGTCRQLIYELCGQIDIVVATPEGIGTQVRSTQVRTSDLLPHPFQAPQLRHHDRA